MRSTPRSRSGRALPTIRVPRQSDFESKERHRQQGPSIKHIPRVHRHIMASRPLSEGRSSFHRVGDPERMRRLSRVNPNGAPHSYRCR